MTDAIPLIDLAPFPGGGRGAGDVARAVAEACERTGFLVIAGHGVDPRVVAALREAGRDFFDLPLDEKLAVRRPRDDQNRGYIPYGEETLARMHGGDTPPDFKEVFAIGPPDVPDEEYFTGSAAYPSFAPNLWPRRPAALEPAMRAYFGEMERLMRRLAAVFALALDLDAEYFEPRLDRHTSQLRLLHYPAPAAALEPGQLRCGEHTDLGMMTVLLNEAAAGGLEVRDRDGRWLSAPAVDGTFVVNIGDMMMRWTNDRWRSTPHRVAEPPAGERAASRRMSIGFFVGPNYDALVECLPTCRSQARPPRYEPVTVHDYRTARFASGAGVAAGAGR